MERQNNPFRGRTELRAVMNNIMNGYIRNIIDFGKLTLRQRTLFDLNNLFISKFVVSITSTFVTHISTIVFGSSNKQMKRINTSGIITTMANKMSLRNFPSIKDYSKFMSSPIFSLISKKAVSIFILPTLKFLTTISNWFNSFEKILFAIFSHKKIITQKFGVIKCH